MDTNQVARSFAFASLRRREKASAQLEKRIFAFLIDEADQKAHAITLQRWLYILKVMPLVSVVDYILIQAKSLGTFPENEQLEKVRGSLTAVANLFVFASRVFAIGKKGFPAAASLPPPASDLENIRAPGLNGDSDTSSPTTSAAPTPPLKQISTMAMGCLAEAKKQVRDRDNYTCNISNFPGNFGIGLDICHVFPKHQQAELLLHGFTTSNLPTTMPVATSGPAFEAAINRYRSLPMTTLWLLLDAFLGPAATNQVRAICDPGPKGEKNSMTREVLNLLTLTNNLHNAFDAGMLNIIPVESTPEPTDLTANPARKLRFTIRWNHEENRGINLYTRVAKSLKDCVPQHIRLNYNWEVDHYRALDGSHRGGDDENDSDDSGDGDDGCAVLEMRTTNPDKAPLPHPWLLRLNASLMYLYCKFSGASGAIGDYDKWKRELGLVPSGVIDGYDKPRKEPGWVPSGDHIADYFRGASNRHIPPTNFGYNGNDISHLMDNGSDDSDGVEYRTSWSSLPCGISSTNTIHTEIDLSERSHGGQTLDGVIPLEN